MAAQHVLMAKRGDGIASPPSSTLHRKFLAAVPAQGAVLASYITRG